jgi:hypothetical protein
VCNNLSTLSRDDHTFAIGTEGYYCMLQSVDDTMVVTPSDGIPQPVSGWTERMFTYTGLTQQYRNTGGVWHIIMTEFEGLPQVHVLLQSASVYFPIPLPGHRLRDRAPMLESRLTFAEANVQLRQEGCVHVVHWQDGVPDTLQLHITENYARTAGADERPLLVLMRSVLLKPTLDRQTQELRRLERTRSGADRGVVAIVLQLLDGARAMRKGAK